MNLVNRQFRNLRPPFYSGWLLAALEEVYFPHLLHATFRNLNRPCGTIRRSHSHPVYHVVLVTDGCGHFLLGEQSLRAEPGQIFITSPGEPHSFESILGDTTEYCEVTFEFRSRAGKLLTLPFHELLGRWTEMPVSRPISGAAASAELHILLMQEIENLVRNGLTQLRHLDLLVHGSLARIFQSLFINLYYTAPGNPADPIHRVQEFLDENFSQSVTLRQLAKIANVSPNYLSRRFKQRFGTTPISYQQVLRIQAAANLLRTTNHPIKDISTITGFSDVYFFSRVFKKVHHLPPGKYRQMTRSM